MLNENQKCPDIQLDNQNGECVSFSDYLGKKIVLYIYPKDDTPGCTIEAQEFSALLEKFQEKNTHIFGLSKDSTKKHESFCKKYNLSVDLLSDPEGELIDALGAWQEKNMYGRKYMGIVRTTYLLNEEGKVEKIWEKVKAKGHAQEILDYIS
ncbi:peroxiredoxin [Candidatus Marinamargulisbacteria bacterium SCGC AG-343-D04]|nr:peroxiredoxin [Candidatus Marinamargulisbacteria bacterium SCGC AG-343-D04]